MRLLENPYSSLALLTISLTVTHTPTHTHTLTHSLSLSCVMLVKSTGPMVLKHNKGFKHASIENDLDCSTTQRLKRLNCAGVVSVLAFNSDDTSLNPAEACSFFCKMLFENNENKQKRGRDWSIFKKR